MSTTPSPKGEEPPAPYYDFTINDQTHTLNLKAIKTKIKLSGEATEIINELSTAVKKNRVSHISSKAKEALTEIRKNYEEKFTTSRNLFAGITHWYSKKHGTLSKFDKILQSANLFTEPQERSREVLGVELTILKPMEGEPKRKKSDDIDAPTFHLPKPLPQSTPIESVLQPQSVVTKEMTEDANLKLNKIEKECSEWSAALAQKSIDASRFNTINQSRGDLWNITRGPLSKEDFDNMSETITQLESELDEAIAEQWRALQNKPQEVQTILDQAKQLNILIVPSITTNLNFLNLNLNSQEQNLANFLQCRNLFDNIKPLLVPIQNTINEQLGPLKESVVKTCELLSDLMPAEYQQQIQKAYSFTELQNIRSKLFTNVRKQIQGSKIDITQLYPPGYKMRPEERKQFDLLTTNYHQLTEKIFGLLNTVMTDPTIKNKIQEIDKEMKSVRTPLMKFYEFLSRYAYQVSDVIESIVNVKELPQFLRYNDKSRSPNAIVPDMIKLNNWLAELQQITQQQIGILKKRINDRIDARNISEDNKKSLQNLLKEIPTIASADLLTVAKFVKKKIIPFNMFKMYEKKIPELSKNIQAELISVTTNKDDKLWLKQLLSKIPKINFKKIDQVHKNVTIVINDFDNFIMAKKKIIELPNDIKAELNITTNEDDKMKLEQLLENIPEMDLKNVEQVHKSVNILINDFNNFRIEKLNQNINDKIDATQGAYQYKLEQLMKSFSKRVGKIESGDLTQGNKVIQETRKALKDLETQFENPKVEE